jgi:hypothetical protein
MFKLDEAVHGGKDGVILAQAHVVTRLDFGASLTDDDSARSHCLAAIPFHSQTLAGAIPTVTACTAAFLMSHLNSPLSRLNDDFVNP